MNWDHYKKIFRGCSHTVRILGLMCWALLLIFLIYKACLFLKEEADNRSPKSVLVMACLLLLFVVASILMVSYYQNACKGKFRKQD